jgi:hypothetical protein
VLNNRCSSSSSAATAFSCDRELELCCIAAKMRAFSRLGTRPNRTAETRDTSGQLAASSQPPVYKQYTRTLEMGFYPFNTTQLINSCWKVIITFDIEDEFLH